MLPGTEHTTIKTNGVQLHVVSAGPASGRPIIFLHGFPEFWYGWRRQIPFFAAAGYRVIAPDQRGYNLSEKPAGVASYRVNLLSDDVIGLIDALGYEKVILVGHDWGAAVAWWTAGAHPERLEKLVHFRLSASLAPRTNGPVTQLGWCSECTRRKQQARHFQPR